MSNIIPTMRLQSDPSSPELRGDLPAALLRAQRAAATK